MKGLSEIQLRDPFVFPSPTENVYYLFGTSDSDPWRGPGTGFDVYRGSDLHTWDGPHPAFRPPTGFWATTNFWAPEVHRYRGEYYMFASFKADGRSRATQIFRANAPAGPYRPHSPGPITPRDWECLDGTLHVDPDGAPWMVFCHEWVQVHDGQVCAVPLSDDLRYPTGDPIILFSAGSSPWAQPITREGHDNCQPNFVTDGPFVFTTSAGQLLLLWSSFTSKGYAMGVARSDNGRIDGTWSHENEPIVDTDAGHGMVFATFDGQLQIAVHTPNRTPDERPIFIPVTEVDGTLRRDEHSHGAA